MSAFKPNQARSYFNSHLRAPCADGGRTPRTSFAGTLSRKGPTPIVPGRARPEMLELQARLLPSKALSTILPGENILILSFA